jgi:mxaJ protein
MCFRFLSSALAAVLTCFAHDAPVLRICADPNNLPFSNQQGQGFENKLAELVASKLNERVEYTWWSQRKSFVKNSLNEHKCDALMGVPTSLDSVEVTRPYYESSYVFVSRGDRNLNLASLTDPRLSNWRIGENFAPPAFALAHRGITQNIVPFSLFGPYGELSPPRAIVDAVSRGDVDVAIVWGPFAGYFAKSSPTPLTVVPVSPPVYFGVPFTYSISMAVRKGDDQLKQQLDRILRSESASVQRILTEYGVPQSR